jgi:hypothetical protein
MERWISKLVVFVVSILLILLFVLVVAFVKRTHLSGTIGEIVAFPQEQTGNVSFLHRSVFMFSIILFSLSEISHLMLCIRGHSSSNVVQW